MQCHGGEALSSPNKETALCGAARMRRQANGGARECTRPPTAAAGAMRYAG